MAKPTDGNPTLALNRKARYDFFIEDTLEAGLVLKGVEIKSMREGRANLRDSFVVIRNGEAWVRNMHLSPYDQASTHEDELDPVRPRKLLLHRRQIEKLDEAIGRDGMTIVPLRLYLKDNRAKLEIGLAKGKKQYDKRATEKDREWQRERQRLVKSGTRG